jgi:predicted dehydrogenase
MGNECMVRYGIVGCGMMGREHIRNISLLPETSIVGVFDPDPEMCKLTKEIVPDTEFFQSLQSLLKEVEFDCLVVATPNFRHIDDLYEILKYSNKPILIEKPVVTSLEDTRKLTEFSKLYKAPVWVAMEYRYMPALQQFISEGTSVTGGVKMLTIREHRFPFLSKVNNWNRFNKYTGGTFVEKCCHFFDLMRLIIGCNPVQIMASGGQVCNHLNETYDGFKPDIWDSGFVIVDFENGARCMLELCMFADGAIYQEEISAVGSKGKIECKIPGPKRFWKNDKAQQPEALIVTSERESKLVKETLISVDGTLLDVGDHNGATFYQHEKFKGVVSSGDDVKVSMQDGIWAVRMGLAAQLSSMENRTVKILEFL